MNIIDEIRKRVNEYQKDGYYSKTSITVTYEGFNNIKEDNVVYGIHLFIQGTDYLINDNNLIKIGTTKKSIDSRIKEFIGMPICKWCGDKTPLPRVLQDLIKIGFNFHLIITKLHSNSTSKKGSLEKLEKYKYQKRTGQPIIGQKIIEISDGERLINQFPNL